MRERAVTGRRALLLAGVAALLPSGAGAVGFSATGRDFLGPFYVADADSDPALNSSGLPGTPVSLAGRLRAAGSGRPLAGIQVEIWQADGAGRYHPPGSGKASDYPPGALALRGRLFTDAEGRYAATSVVPGDYGFRPRHWHLRLSGPGIRSLVTQLYITGDVSRGRQPGAPDRHAPLVAGADGLRYDAPDLFLVVA